MLRRFFQDYKQLEGKPVEVDEIAPAEMAYPVIEDAIQRYNDLSLPIGLAPNVVAPRTETPLRNPERKL